MSQRASSSHREGRGGRGGRGGGHSHSHNEDPLIRSSKALSRVLRHTAQKDLPNGIGEDGYVLVSDVLKYLRISQATLDSIVETNNKQRFEYSEDKTRIRARQGHTISTLEDDLLLTPVTSSTVNYGIHGTFKKVKQDIISSGGLDKMSRNHVHMAPYNGSTDDDDVRRMLTTIPGVRTNASLIVVVDVKVAEEEGKCSFFLSNNNVLLCKERIPLAAMRFVNV